MALTNQRKERFFGGNEGKAPLLKAAVATTNSGNNRKPRIAKTARIPKTPSSR